MHCPDCSREMMVVTLGTTPPVKLDACSWCGGVWADQSEANFFRESDLPAVGIPPQHVHRIGSPQTRLCPKDQTPLERTRGENVPEDISLYHCPTCGGTWFPAGQLKRFKRAQRTKLAFFKAWHIPVASPSAILLSVFLLLVITGSLVVTVTSIQQELQTQSQAKTLIGTPTSRNISSTEVFISFSTNTPIPTSLVYWKQSDPMKRQRVTISATAQSVHTIRLSKLSSGTTYQYQIILEGTQPVSTEVFIFNTSTD